MRKLLQLFLHGGPVSNGRILRPVWQIVLLVPVFLIYFPARLIVELVDRRL